MILKSPSLKIEWHRFVALILVSVVFTNCAFTGPYVGVNPNNPQFLRGRPFKPLDIFGDIISKPYQILFLNFRYGNHRVSQETEEAMAEFLDYYGIKDVRVSINRWAPFEEMMRAYKNPEIGWPYKIILPIFTLLYATLGRPFSGLIISDYYDPTSNTIHIFSDDKAIALHEAGHAKDFFERKYQGSYSMTRLIPFVDLAQEYIASDYAMQYFEDQKQYDELLRSYKVLIPAYLTYTVSYFHISPLAPVGAILAGHVIGYGKSKTKEMDLELQGRIPKKKKAKGEKEVKVEEREVQVSSVETSVNPERSILRTPVTVR